MFKTTGMLAMLGIIAVAGFGFRASAQDEAEGVAQEEQQNGKPMMMQCPMMDALKSVQLHADAPPVLLAQEEQLQLTAQQKEQLRELAEAARNQAREVLTDEQREKLEKAPAGPLSPMQLTQVLKKPQAGQADDAEEKPMCPMCMKMMRQMRAQQAGDDRASSTDHPPSQQRDGRGSSDED